VSIIGSIVITVIDTAMVNLALPTITRDLGISPATATWLPNAYLLAVVTTLLPAASLGEIFGFRRVFLLGMLVFSLGGIASALAPSFWVLLLCRVVQGVASSAVQALTAGVVRYTYPAAQLGRAIGINATSVAISSAAAPTLAAAILAVAPWPALFAVVAPIGLVCCVIGWKALPNTPRSGRSFDAPSAWLNVLTFGLLFLGIDMLLPRTGLALVVLGISGMCCWLLVARQLTMPAPMLPLDLLRNRVIGLAVCGSIFGFSAWSVSYVALPFLLQDAGWSQVQTGLVMTPWPVALAIAAPLAGRLSDRVSTAVLCAGGMGSFALGLLLISGLGGAGPMLLLGTSMALCGVGFGFFQTPNNRTLLGAAPKARSGGAGGLQATARLLGHTNGTTIMALCFQLAGAGGPRLALAFGVAFALLAAGFSLSRRNVRSSALTP
jgi:DHA2 family multidrug resistance protein-like MFS transporter